ncbi:hypothetical protein MOB41_16850 [Bacillus haynesii]|uniref:hypothetical protein n=1 Tax=Bacillus haynesii TaxID=1925021 RepID=UPI00227F9330|nr:hypothetical protein [Bacillus haynesii]MCY7780070.1 hypothetical protein [Bacillus haynesii]MEC0669652.1 hypothetical protein [Bacillus haynesii]
MLIDIRDPDTMKINGKGSFILTKNKHAVHLKNNESSTHVILEDLAGYGLAEASFKDKIRLTFRVIKFIFQ